MNNLIKHTTEKTITKDLTDRTHIFNVTSLDIVALLESLDIIKPITLDVQVEYQTQYRIKPKVNSTVEVFKDDDQTILTWCRTEDLWALTHFINFTNSKWFKFGYIAGTDSPMQVRAGMQSAFDGEGYIMWIKNN